MWHVKGQGRSDKATLVVRMARDGDPVGLPLAWEVVSSSLSVCRARSYSLTMQCPPTWGNSL